jgi:hypothetical protein
MSNEAPLSPWQRIANKALEQIPQLIVAALAALVLFCAGLWLDHRDHAHAIADLQRAVDALRNADGTMGTTLAELSAACVRRPECEQTRDQLVHLRDRVAHLEGKMGLGVTR